MGRHKASVTDATGGAWRPFLVFQVEPLSRFWSEVRYEYAFQRRRCTTAVVWNPGSNLQGLAAWPVSYSDERTPSSGIAGRQASGDADVVIPALSRGVGQRGRESLAGSGRHRCQAGLPARGCGRPPKLDYLRRTSVYSSVRNHSLLSGRG